MSTSSERSKASMTLDAREDYRVMRISKWYTPLLVGAVFCVTLLPFLTNLDAFRALYWFGDDWDLMREVYSTGVLGSAFKPAVEEVVPVYKILWGLIALRTHGNYMLFLELNWLIHVAIVLAFLGLLLLTTFTHMEALIACLLFGLSWTNIETLTWAAQLSHLLAILFFLLAWLLLVIYQRRSVSNNGVLFAGVIGLLLLSAFSFARGLLGGLLLGFYAWVGEPALSWRRIAWLVGTPASAAVIYGVVLAGAGTVPSQPQAHLTEIVQFSVYYYGLNPLFDLVFAQRPMDDVSVALVGALKLAIWGWAILPEKRKGVRSVLVTLFVFDLFDAALVGLGRYWTTTAVTTGSRYQYATLLCFAPAASVAFSRLVSTVFRSRRLLSLGAYGFAVLFLTFGFTVQWHDTATAWAQWRGVEIRAALADPASTTPFAYSLTSPEQARQMLDWLQRG